MGITRFCVLTFKRRMAWQAGDRRWEASEVLEYWVLPLLLRILVPLHVLLSCFQSDPGFSLLLICISLSYPQHQLSLVLFVRFIQACPGSRSVPSSSYSGWLGGPTHLSALRHPSPDPGCIRIEKFRQNSRTLDLGLRGKFWPGFATKIQWYHTGCFSCLDSVLFKTTIKKNYSVRNRPNYLKGFVLFRTHINNYKCCVCVSCSVVSDS